MITINGESYSEQALRQQLTALQNASDVPPWYLSVFGFLVEWLDAKTEIALHTSGSTGAPKQLYVRKDAMLASARRTVEYFGLKAGDSALLCLPVKYIAGKMMVVRALAGGLNLVVEPPSATPLMSCDVSIDFAAVTPMQLRNIVKIGAIDKVRTVLVGGGVVGEDLREVVASISETRVVESYGMTETLSHIALRALNGQGNSVLFSAMLGVLLRQDARGCLVVDDSITGCRNVVTNDLVDGVDECRFRLLGRIDNVINSGGIKLYPERIEAKLARYMVDTRFCVGRIPDAILGETVALFVENEYCPLSCEEMTKILDRYEMPKRIFCGIRFNLTESGKIIRGALWESVS